MSNQLNPQAGNGGQNPFQTPGPTPSSAADVKRPSEQGYVAPPPRRDSLGQRIQHDVRPLAPPDKHVDDLSSRTWLLLGLAVAAMLFIVVTLVVAVGAVFFLVGVAPRPRMAVPQQATRALDTIPTPAVAPPTIAPGPVSPPTEATVSTTPPLVDGAAQRSENGSPPKTNVFASGSPMKSSGPTAPATSTDERLRYGWKLGQNYPYQFKVEAEIGERKIDASGSVIYTPSNASVATIRQPSEEKGTGTGFVVNGTGHLLSCAHVVKGATKIEATFDGREFPARIVALDYPRDLAILQVDGLRLAPLVIGDSATVELAQDVRVVGFPLTDVLGSSIKVTKGTIAGLIERKGSKLLQVDASINAGNSGGPLVDEAGEVIGVASAKLCGEEISNVGFAVPAAEVREFLRKHNIAFTASRPAAANSLAKLAGPELARRITPSVALLRVTSGPGGFGQEEQVTLKYSSSMTTHERQAPLRPDRFGSPRISPPRINYPRTDRGELLADIAGEVHSGEPELQLPFLLGPAALLALEPLGEAGEKTWNRQRAISITSKKEEDSSPFGPGFFRPPSFRGPFGPEPREPREKPATVGAAFERIEYELSETNPTSAVIKKRYELSMLDDKADPRFQVKGEGKLDFDRQQGVPRSLTFELTIEYTKGNVSLRIPVKFSYQQGAVQPAQNAAINPASVPPINPNAIPDPAPGKPITAETELKPGAKIQAWWGGRWYDSEVIDVQADGQVKLHYIGWGKTFDEALPRNRLRFAPEGTAPPPAAAALLGDDELTELLRKLPSTDRGIVWGALTRLSQADAPARRAEVAKAIEQLMLSSTDIHTRQRAASALPRWANEESVPALLAALRDTHFPVRHSAIAMFGDFRQSRCAEALVSVYKENGFQCKASLIKLGPVAEDAVLTLFASPDWPVRNDACNMLKEIGTDKSIAALREQTEKDKGLVRVAAAAAIQAIEARRPGKS